MKAATGGKGGRRHYQGQSNRELEKRIKDKDYALAQKSADQKEKAAKIKVCIQDNPPTSGSGSMLQNPPANLIPEKLRVWFSQAGKKKQFWVRIRWQPQF